MNHKTSLSLKNVIEYFPLFWVSIVFLSFIKLLIYYKSFNVDIVSFLSLSEVLTLFLNEIALFVLLSIVGIFFFYMELPGYYSQRQILIQKITKEDGFFRRAKLHLILHKEEIILIIASIGASLSVNFFKGENLHIDIIGPCLLVITILAVIFDEVTIQHEKIFGVAINRRIIQITYCFLVLMTYTVMLSLLNVNKTRSDKIYSEVSFEVNKVLIQSDQFNYYIGNTENYLFFYREQENRTTVYPMNTINSLSFKEHKTDKNT